ncbi:MAG: TetR/AcrR family transcriptional regulator [Limosilactobacillus sp.]
MNKKSAENRKSIMQAIAKIITTDGYGSVSMSRVAKETNLSVATAYNYFANKHDMIATTYHEYCELINEHLTRCVNSKTAPDIQLAAYMRGIYQFAQEKPVIFLFTNTIFNSPLNQEMSESANWTNSIMSPWIDIASRGIEEGYFRRMDPLALIYMAYNTVAGMIVDVHQHNVQPDQVSIDEVVIIFMNGIRQPLRRITDNNTAR